ncbi:MAG TPA: sigma-70 family RNA polymerase sigma factor [bacterium]|nr:sigma-70 family RNA polymerase sigma factor [bacterium]
MTRPMAGGTVPLLSAADDQALLARIADEDAGAFETLYARYSAAAYSVAIGLLRDAAQAQEVTQDVFLAIWRGARGFDPARGSARTWILSVAHHKSVDAVRRSRRNPTVPLSETMTGAADVIEAAQARVDAGHVRRALEGLSIEQRAAIVLAYYGGYTQQEIAQRLGVPLGTIKTRMRDGLLRLRTVLPAPAPETAQ